MLRLGSKSMSVRREIGSRIWKGLVDQVKGFIVISPEGLRELQIVME